MTTQRQFDKDLAKVQAAIEAIPGALNVHSDGFVSLNMTVISVELADLYANLMRYGYANGLV